MKLNKALKLYIKYLTYERNLSFNTVDSYDRDIRQFLKFIEKKEISDSSDLHLDVFRQFLKYLDQFKYSNRTIIRKYSSYINFFKFLEDNDYIDKQISQLIIPPKKHRKLYTFFSQTEIRDLFESIDVSTNLGIRNRALLEFIYSTGARVSEAANIKMTDLDTGKDEVSIFGKGRKFRIAYLNNLAKKWLNKYLDIRNELIYRKEPGAYIDNDYLFLNKSGSRLTVRGIRNILSRCLKNASFKKKLSPHSIRHSFATHLIQEGAGIREIQELLGHENISTSQIYTHLNIKKIKDDYKKFHPRAK